MRKTAVLASAVSTLVAAAAWFCYAQDAAKPAPAAASRWAKLATETYFGKQDDVVFLDARTGWYGNGIGKVFGTEDGGTTWTKLTHMPGTFVRALAFLDKKHGFFGNIGPDVFPHAFDATLLYETVDGGVTWSPVDVKPEGGRGICAIDVVTRPILAGGETVERTVIHAGGRVDGPAHLYRSADLGKTWRTEPLPEGVAQLLDVKFIDLAHGFVCAGTDADLEHCHAAIYATTDGGATWEKRFEASRPYELVWKCSFPTRDVGYATLLNADPDKTHTKHWFAKTTDGGKTWTESFLIDDPEGREFGVGFVTADHGWIGCMGTALETTDGGKTWVRCDMGRAVNKIRFVPTDHSVVGYSIGVDLCRIELPGEHAGIGK